MVEDNNCPKCEKGAPKWMVTFGDMMSLLLTFFVLLLSFANMDMQKYKDVLGSMEKAFGVQKKIYQLGKPGGQEGKIKEVEKAKTEAEKEKERLVNLLKTMVREEGLDRNIFIVADKTGVRMEIAGSVMFLPGQTSLIPQAKRLFRKLIPILQATIYKISVEGHSDNTPFTSTSYPSNWELSSARAGTVVRFLIEEGKLNPRRFTAVGCADTKPLVENDTPENRAKNRRVSIIYEVI